MTTKTPEALAVLTDALKRIEGGSIPGAVNYAISGNWQGFVNALQDEARKALAAVEVLP